MSRAVDRLFEVVGSGRVVPPPHKTSTDKKLKVYENVSKFFPFLLMGYLI